MERGSLNAQKHTSGEAPGVFGYFGAILPDAGGRAHGSPSEQARSLASHP